jgi:Zn-dependent protease
MARCTLCGQEELLFICPYCNGSYCSEHRLPESHGCPSLQRARQDARKKIADSFTGEYEEEDEEEEENVTAPTPPRRNPIMPRPERKSRFSRQEIRDLLIASVLVTLVAISMLGSGYGIIDALPEFVYTLTTIYWWYPVVLIAVFLFSFLFHEMAHKFVAQHYGMWSEFRMTSYGYYLSAFAILLSVPVFGTGAVFTRTSANPDEVAKSTLAGPLSNAILASALLAITIVSAVVAGGVHYPFSYILRWAIILNAMLGLFNMIPLPPLDGAKIFLWRKRYWALQTSVLVALLISGYVLVPMLWA